MPRFNGLNTPGEVGRLSGVLALFQGDLEFPPGLAIPIQVPVAAGECQRGRPRHLVRGRGQGARPPSDRSRGRRTILRELPERQGRRRPPCSLACAAATRGSKARWATPRVKSQSLSVLSPLPESTVRPSGAMATLLTPPECPVKVRSSFPLARSQSFSVLSALPESAVRPSGAMATLVTLLGVPGEGAQLFSAGQVPELQRTVATPRERCSAVRGNGDAAHPSSERPVNVRSSFPLARSQSFSVLS